MDVLLIAPPRGHRAERWRSGAEMAPLGLAYLAGALESAGLSVRILDCHAGRIGFGALARQIAESRPRIVGLSFATEDRFGAFRCARVVKRVDPGIVTVAGGPHASATADDILTHVPAVDAVVRGEGERAVVALAEGRDWAGIESLSYRTGTPHPLPGPCPERERGKGAQSPERQPAGASICHNPPAAPVDLDSLSPPALHRLDWPRYRFTMADGAGRQVPAANLMTSRGCPFRCPYCVTPRMFGRQFRALSLEATIGQLDRLERDFAVRAFWFFDDTFTIDRGRVERLCEHLAGRPGKPVWFCEIRPETVSRELLAAMAGAGCTEVGLGAETGSPRLAKALNRAAALERTEAVAAWCRDLGITIHPFFICSLPDETADDLDRTYALAAELAAMGHRPTVGVLRIYPGTRYESLARERGLLPPDFRWSDESSAGGSLAALHGAAPLWIEPDHWKDVARFLARWTRIQPVPLGRRAWKALRSVRSAGELARYWSLGQACFREMLARKR